MKKRVFTLTGSIVGTVFTAILSIVMFVYFVRYCTWNASSPYSYEGYIILYMAIDLVAIAALVLNALSINAYAKDKEAFKKKKPIIIAAIVFNFLIAVYYLVSMFLVSAAYYATIVFWVLWILLLIMINVFYIVDLCLEKNRTGVEVKPEEPILAQPVKPIQKPVAKKTNFDDLYDELERLGKLKDAGIINEKEFNTMKTDILNRK